MSTAYILIAGTPMAITTGSPSSARRPADVVREHLAHYLGPFTSKNAVQLMAKQKLSIDADQITTAQIPALLEALGPALRTLLGKAGCERVIEEIRHDLAC